MRFPRNKLIVLLLCTCALVACGSSDEALLDVQRPRDPVENQQMIQPVNVTAAAGKALQTRRNELVMFLVVGSRAEKKPEVPSPDPLPVTPPAIGVPVPTTTSTIGEGVPCGGDLPPCYVVERESNGTWNAFNDGGCGGNNCYGPYQFSGAWAGKLGLPQDLSTTTPEQWVNAARELYANGAGCSHWAAC